MKFMLTIYGDASWYASASEADMSADMAAYYDYDDATQAAGVQREGAALHPPETAKTVRIHGDERTVTDGPFAETKEVLGGYYVLECKDLDEAIEWAAKIPGAQNGTIEVRPVVNFDA